MVIFSVVELNSDGVGPRYVVLNGFAGVKTSRLTDSATTNFSALDDDDDDNGKVGSDDVIRCIDTYII